LGETPEILWEKGKNREIALYSLLRNVELYLEDFWNKRLFRLWYPEDNPERGDKYSMHVIGTIPELGGNNMNFKKMKLQFELLHGTLLTVWDLSFFVDVDQTPFFYTYVKFSRQKKKVFFDRRLYRECNLSYATANHLEVLRPAFWSVDNTYFKFDQEMSTDFFLSRLDSFCAYGPYPQASKDYKALQENNVDTIVNIMTKQELNECLYHLSMARKLALRFNINIVHLGYNGGASFKERVQAMDEICNKLDELNNEGRQFFLCDREGSPRVEEVLVHLLENQMRETPQGSHLLQLLFKRGNSN
jgi:hypothetical protein